MEKDASKLDSLIEDIGCGPFQIILVTIICLAGLPNVFPYYFMAFGLYSPGWRCLDNETLSVNTTDPTIRNETTPVYLTDSCVGFDTCNNVEFSPEASTIATEFGLICGRSWITSLCISMFMVGNGVSYIFVGIAGDKFGRIKAIQVSTFVLIVLHIVSMFSTSWQMFAATEFLIGVISSFGTLVMVVSNEFVPHVWRLRVGCLPIWTIGCATFALLSMLFHHWKTLKLCTSILFGISFLALFWAPKTPRFLSANGKKKQFLRLMKKIEKYNKIEMPQERNLDLILEVNSENRNKNNKKAPPSIFSLLRKGYRVKTLVIGFSFLFLDLTYFAMTFGVSALPGNVYQNMLITTLSELPSNLFAMTVGNMAGRRISVTVFTILGSLCFFAVAACDLLTSGGARVVSTLVSLVVAKLFLNAGWYVLATSCLEMYPTLVRSTINSFARMMSMTGGVLAPYLIPSEPSTFYICYLVMGVLMFLVGVLALLLPETKGKALLDDWDDYEENVKCEKLADENNNAKTNHDTNSII